MKALRSSLGRWRRRARMARIVGKALLSTRHPVLAHVIVIRRCNLACTYCNEFDDRSPPVPTDEVLRRLDRLAALGTSMVTLSGGEPLLHPDLDRLILHGRRLGMMVELLTNAYLLTEQRIERLNEAHLDRLQISVDNVQPDEVSKKSLKVLDAKLQLLARHALFDVNVNSVLGSELHQPEDTWAVATRARQLGLGSTVGVLHDGRGQLRPLPPPQRAAYERITRGEGRLTHWIHTFKHNLVEGRPNQWSCRAGARYLYICEDGLVHYCSQQRGAPGIPLERYTRDDLRREFQTEKSCAPMCTVSCVHVVSVLDAWRPAQAPSPAPSAVLTDGSADGDPA